MGVGDALGRVGFTVVGEVDWILSFRDQSPMGGGKEEQLGRRLFAEKKLQQPTQLCTHVTVT